MEIYTSTDILSIKGVSDDQWREWLMKESGVRGMKVEVALGSGRGVSEPIGDENKLADILNSQLRIIACIVAILLHLRLSSLARL